MSRLTADISNAKLWVTSDLCGEPPVSSYPPPPPVVAGGDRILHTLDGFM